MPGPFSVTVKADAVDAYRPFHNHISQQLMGGTEPRDERVALGSERLDRGDALYDTDDMPTQAIGWPQGPLEIHALTRLEAARIGPPVGLRHHVGDEGVPHDFRDGQIHAVDRDGVTETRIGKQLWRAHAQHSCASLDDLANLFNDAGEHLSSSLPTPPRHIPP